MFNKLFTWLENYIPVFPAQPPEKPPNDLLGFVLFYTRPFTKLIAVGGLLAVIVAVLEVYLFSFMGNLVDWLSNSDKDNFLQQHKNYLITISILLLVILPILKFLYESILHQGILGNFSMRIRWQAHRYLLRQSLVFFHNDFAGRIATKMMQSALGVRDTVIKITEVLLYVAVYFTSAVILFASSDLRLALPMIIWFIAYLIVLKIFIPRLQNISKIQADARSSVTGRVVDSYTNIQTIKMFASDGQEDEYAEDGMQTFLKTVYNQMRLSTWVVISLHCLNALLLFSICTLSVWLWHINAITIGVIAFAVGLVFRIQGMAQWILWELYGLFENIGMVQDGMATISQNSSVVDIENAKPLVISKAELAYQNIYFNYGKQRNDVQKGVIDNFSLSVGSGEKIGIVGRSGAGKSTLVNLLLRFYDVEGGRIVIDDQDIAKVTQSSLRQAIGMVSQDTSLLHRTVYENIAYGITDANYERVIEVAKKAYAHDFIQGLEDINGNTGYDAQVGERGVKLSGGQRQRIAIARLILKDAPIVILDEATSSLDSESEHAIQQSFQYLMKNRTVIAIAHRLSTIAAMDRLIVMDEGNILEQGSHSELLSNNGLYYELWSRQSGGFICADEEELKIA